MCRRMLYHEYEDITKMQNNNYGSWPGGYRHAMTQSEHDSWNSRNYPGTRQLCEKCEEPTERCEDDSIFLDDGTGPLCEECYLNSGESKAAVP